MQRLNHASSRAALSQSASPASQDVRLCVSPPSLVPAARRRPNAAMAGPSTPPVRRAPRDEDALSAASLSAIQARIRFPSLAAHSARHSQSPPPRRRGRRGEPRPPPPEHEFVAPFLGRLIMSAHEELGECPEMAAVWAFVDAVRRAARCHVRPQDVDIRNGVALLEVLALLFAGEPGVPPVPEPERDLDEAGAVGKRNVQAVCAALREYPWLGLLGGGVEGRRDRDGAVTVKAVQFQNLDPWALGGYVMLAAVTCDRSPRYLDIIESLPREIQELISGLVQRAMTALGIPANFYADELSDVSAKPPAQECIGSAGEPEKNQSEHSSLGQDVDRDVDGCVPEKFAVAAAHDHNRDVGSTASVATTETSRTTSSSVDADQTRPRLSATASAGGVLSAGSDEAKPGTSEPTSPRPPLPSSPSRCPPTDRSTPARTPTPTSSSPRTPPSSSHAPPRRSTQSWAAEVAALTRRLAAAEARAEAAERRTPARTADRGGRAELAALRRRCADAERRCALLERQLLTRGKESGSGRAGGSGAGGGDSRGGTPSRRPRKV